MEPDIPDEFFDDGVNSAITTAVEDDDVQIVGHRIDIDRDWTAPTPFSRCFPTLTSVMLIWTTWLRTLDLGDVRKLIPETCGFLRACEPQFQRLQGRRNVLLVLGTCRLKAAVPSLQHPSSLTEKILSALPLIGVEVILIDLRKECRRIPRGIGCQSFSQKEADMLTWATAIEIAILSQAYDIQFSGIVTFAEPWYKQFAALLRVPMVAHLSALAHLHIDTHLGWVGQSGARASARLQSKQFSAAFLALSESLAHKFGPLFTSAQQIYTSFHQTLPELALRPFADVFTPSAVVQPSQKFMDSIPQFHTLMGSFFNPVFAANHLAEHEARISPYVIEPLKDEETTLDFDAPFPFDASLELDAADLADPDPFLLGDASSWPAPDPNDDVFTVNPSLLRQNPVIMADGLNVQPALLHDSSFTVADDLSFEPDLHRRDSVISVDETVEAQPDSNGPVQPEDDHEPELELDPDVMEDEMPGDDQAYNPGPESERKETPMDDPPSRKRKRVTASIPTETDGNTCGICNKDFENSRKLKKHIQQQHSNKYTCAVTGCEKGYGTKSDLRRHEMTAHPTVRAPKIYECTEPGCKETFRNRRDNLIRHMRMKHGKTMSKDE